MVGGKRVKPIYSSEPLYKVTNAWKDKVMTDECYLFINYQKYLIF